jgi:hypothetical protein
MAMLDDPDETLECFEDGESSRMSTPTPLYPNKTLIHQSNNNAATTHTINVNYRHCYSLERKNGTDLDMPELLESLAKHIKLESPSRLLSTATLPELQKSSAAVTVPEKVRSLRMVEGGKPIRFTSLHIPDPPNLKYANHMDQLLIDWDDSSHIIIKNVPIPLKYWPQVFRWSRPKAWQVIKNEWSQWQVHSLDFFELQSPHLHKEFCLPSSTLSHLFY